MELWIGAINLGFLYGFMAIGAFITYRIYNFPDMTVDGSFTTGAAVAAVLIVSGVNPFLVIPISFLASAFAGFLTAYIHTRFKINPLLAGILVMTGLYSINLRIMDKSNIPLLNSPSFISALESLNPGMNFELWLCLCLIVVMSIFWLLISLFFKSDFGLTMQATGNNPTMVSANGVNVNWMIMFGVALANGFVGVSGAIVSQYQGFADIGMGVGSIVFSLAAVIIGEALFKSRSIFIKVLSVIIGSIVFRLLVALALDIGLNPNDLKLITAVFVMLTLFTSGTLTGKRKLFSPAKILTFVKKNFKKIGISIIIIIVVIGSAIIYKYGTASAPAKPLRIALFQFTSNKLLDFTSDGVLEGLKSSGILESKNITITRYNADNDYANSQVIAKEIVSSNYDYIITVSTLAMQAIAKANKNIPHIFCAVTDPIKSGAGTSLENHQPNMTGLATPQPVESTIKLMRLLLPDAKRIGIVWNQAEHNSEICTIKARDEVKNWDFTLIEKTISNIGELDAAVKSVINDNIDIFFTSGDNTVSVAVPSLANTMANKKIPYFTNTPDDINHGTFASLGANYYDVGLQAAKLAIRVINGEKTNDIPIVKYVPEKLALNLTLANKLKITISDSIIKRAEVKK